MADLSEYSQNITVSSDDLRLSQPGTILLFGRSGAGKSTLCDRLIRDRAFVFKNAPASLFLVYGSWQEELYGEWRRGFKDNFRSHQGWRDGLSGRIFKDRTEASEPMLLILDDVAHQITQKQFQEEVLSVVNVKATHCNTVILILCQQLVMGGGQGAVLRSIMRNSAGIVLFENPLDAIALRTLSQNIFAGEKKPGTALAHVMELNSLFNDGRYLFVDLHATKPSATRMCDVVCKRKMLRLKSSFYTQAVCDGDEKIRVYL